MEMQLAEVSIDRLDEFLQWFHAELDQWTIHYWRMTIRDHVSQEGQLGNWIARELLLDGVRIAGAYLLIHPGRLGVLHGPLLRSPADKQFGLNGWVAMSPQARQSVQAEGGLDLASCSLDFMVGMARGMLTTAKEAGAGVVQAVVEGQEQKGGLLSKVGMMKVADLRQLECSLRSAVPGRTSPSNAPGLSWRIYSEHEKAIWLELLEKTYEKTLDCPKMNGLRRTEDTWDGYVATAKGDLSEWWIGEWNSEVFGCVMLTRLSEEWMELTYMAALPTFRGQGLGTKMLDFAIERCVRARVETLVLSVDEENRPALHLYEKRGFTEVRRMAAWFWPTPSTIEGFEKAQ